MLKSLVRVSSISVATLQATKATAVLTRPFHNTIAAEKQKLYTTDDVPAVTDVPHLLTDNDLSPQQLADVIQSACLFKHQSKVLNKPSDAPLAGKTLALMFSKRSTRTRVATETAMAYLGTKIEMLLYSANDMPKKKSHLI